VTRLACMETLQERFEYWVQRLTSKGLSGLLDGNHPGRPTRLSVNNLVDLRKDISRNPRELGYDQKPVGWIVAVSPSYSKILHFTWDPAMPEALSSNSASASSDLAVKQ